MTESLLLNASKFKYSVTLLLSVKFHVEYVCGETDKPVFSHAIGKIVIILLHFTSINLL